MLRTILFALSMLAPMVTRAQAPDRWVQYATSKNASYFYDQESLRRLDGGIVELWDRTKFNAPQLDSAWVAGAGSTRKYLYVETRVLVWVLCAKRVFINRKLLRHGPAGNVEETSDFTDSILEGPVVPDTIGDFLFRRACPSTSQIER